MKYKEGDKVTIDTEKSRLIAKSIKESDDRLYEGRIVGRRGEEKYEVMVFKERSSVKQSLFSDCLIPLTYCNSHNVRKVHSDNREEWICPFCEA